ncbi:MAG: glycine--tRNA ligase subunit beta [Burkholderiales bacterium]
MSGASTQANLLVELFTEELPPKALGQLSESFAQSIVESLTNAGLVERDGLEFRRYATPRRLAVWVRDVRSIAPDRIESKKLMPAKVAYDTEGKPSAALGKRLEKESATESQLERKTEAGTQYVFLNRNLPGAMLAAGLQNAMEQAIEKLPIPKLMSYQLADGTSTVKFVRPVHGLVALHGQTVLPIAAFGLSASRVTHGHRFQGQKNIELASADDYARQLLDQGGVMAAFESRRAEIDKQLRDNAARLQASLGKEEFVAPLLDEVCALVENPSVYVGSFEHEFLTVPQECLVLTMRTNQKYFPLFDTSGKLINKFLIVSNMRLADPRNIVEGNQRVVRPRLADARFFFDTDKKVRLENRVRDLARVIYHNKLGTQLERSERVMTLTGQVARAIGADPLLAERAAWLAKADLLTNMVGEFPELQGIMGRYYAIADGEHANVALAIEQHYQPRFAGDALPENGVGAALALADKLETLAGLFGIGQLPTGDKDPYALRRHALGVIRILIEGKLSVSLADLIGFAFAAHPNGKLTDTRAELQLFVHERLRGYLRESGYSANEVESVLSTAPTLLWQIPRQLEAVRAFAELPEAASLAAANKRVANILKQAESKGELVTTTNIDLMSDAAERALFEVLGNTSKLATPLFEAGDFTGYLKAFAVLKAPVDAFFDSVMVMSDDDNTRRNRLALLRGLREEMNRVADIAKLAA